MIIMHFEKEKENVLERTIKFINFYSKNINYLVLFIAINKEFQIFV